MRFLFLVLVAAVVFSDSDSNSNRKCFFSCGTLGDMYVVLIASLREYMITLRPVLLVGTNFSDLKGSWIWRVLPLAIFEPGYKNTTRSWLKERFQMQLQPFWKRSGQTSMTEKRSFCNITI